MTAAKTEEAKAHLINDWLETGHNLFIDLLVSMSKEVGYSFDHKTLKNEIYFPTALQEKFNDDTLIRKGFIKLLAGKAPIAVTFPVDEEIQKKQNILQNSLIDFYDGKKSVKVVIDEKK
jgi:hypothetical protein